MTNRFTTLAATAALFIGFSGPAVAANKTVALGTVGGWKILSLSNTCFGEALFENETRLTHALYPGGKALLFVRKDQWDMPNGPVTVFASIGELPASPLQAKAEGKFLYIPWLINEDEIEFLASGPFVLHLKIDQVDYSYNLRGSAEMMRALLKCRENLDRGANPVTGN
jgi:hypothetical protein